MPIRVYNTTLADIQVSRLRGQDRKAFDSFAENLSHSSCAALGYRLTGPKPLQDICVKHLTGPLRAIVAFKAEDEAWILMVGPHLRDDPAFDVYTLLYALVGVEPPEDEKRTKPPCCDEGSGLPSVLDEVVEDLVARATRLARGRR